MSTEASTSTASADEAKATSAHARATAREKVKRAPDPERRRRILTALAVAAVVIVMLYRPARDYYVAWRTGYLLNIRNEVLAEENQELSSDVERLMTHEGIEDEARKRGWVMPGETSVRVEGLEEPQDEGMSGTSSTAEGEEDLPWFIRVGDVIFFYGADA